MKILHISPSYFSLESWIGGAERYAYRLAYTMAKHHATEFVSFSKNPRKGQDGALSFELLPSHESSDKLYQDMHPFNRLWKKVLAADVIHFHQTFNFAIDFLLPLAKLCRKKVFITDLGRGGNFAFSYHVPIQKYANAFLHISRYSEKLWAQKSFCQRPVRSDVIYGGVDPAFFYPSPEEKSNFILYVGRLLPHKGIHDLIEAADSTMHLKIVGQPYHAEYAKNLKQKAAGKSIEFIESCSDEELVKLYQKALVTVLPSVYTDFYSAYMAIPELLGLTPLESMACGTPVIVTNVASLPEIVDDSHDGFIVAPNNPEALRSKLLFLKQNPAEAMRMGKQGAEKVRRFFTWEKTVERCLSSYEKF